MILWLWVVFLLPGGISIKGQTWEWKIEIYPDNPLDEVVSEVKDYYDGNAVYYVGYRNGKVAITNEKHELIAQTEYDLVETEYIKEEEMAQMESNVLDWEPSLALFVPNDKPLLFYRTIAEKAKTMLTPDGQLYFEINREHGTDTCTMLTELGYTNIHLHKDFAGNDRMVSTKL